MHIFHKYKTDLEIFIDPETVISVAKNYFDIYFKVMKNHKIDAIKAISVGYTRKWSKCEIAGCKKEVQKMLIGDQREKTQ